jgi:transcriptional regulator with XRE-family HTH domain
MLGVQVKEERKMKPEEYFKDALEQSGKSQKQIAEEAGFAKPNIITMFKQGLTPIPLARVPALALALGVPQVELMNVCLGEYHPEILEVIRGTYNI